MAQPRTTRSTLAGSTGFACTVPIVLALLVIVMPLPPPALIDLLLAGNITAAVVILLTTVYVGKPLDFSAIPSILPHTTPAPLVLNVAGRSRNRSFRGPKPRHEPAPTSDL